MSTKSSNGSVDWLSPREESAWRALRSMMTTIQSRTARDLSALGLSEPDYEVLSTLSELADHTSPLHVQATKMGWSRSRLSRHTARMQERGLIRRLPDPADGRGCLLALTDEGLATLQDAAPTHLQSVRRHVIDRLSPTDLRHLERIAGHIMAEEHPSR